MKLSKTQKNSKRFLEKNTRNNVSVKISLEDGDSYTAADGREYIGKPMQVHSYVNALGQRVAYERKGTGVPFVRAERRALESNP